MGLIADIHNDLERGALQLIVEYRSRLRSEALNLCKDESQAEDLVFRTFERVLDKADSYKVDVNLFGWMKSIMEHLYRDDMRRPVASGTRTVAGEELEQYAGADWSTDEQILKNSDSEAIRKAISELDPKYNQVLLMRYYDEFSLKQIAGFLRLPVGTVSWRLHMAHRLLSGKLGVIFGRAKKSLAVLAAVLACSFLSAAAVVCWFVGGDDGETGVLPVQAVESISSEHGQDACAMNGGTGISPVQPVTVSEPRQDFAPTQQNTAVTTKGNAMSIKKIAAAALAATAAVAVASNAQAGTAAPAGAAYQLNAANLPTGYTPVKWIEATGSQWTELDYVPTNTDIVKLRATIQRYLGGGGFFDARNLPANNRFTLTYASEVDANHQTFRVDRGSSSKYSQDVTSRKVYDISVDFNNHMLTVNGEPWVTVFETSPVAEKRCDTNLVLFISRVMNTGLPQAFAHVRLFSFLLTDKNGVEKVNLLPCVKDGVAGLYDTVGQKFYASKVEGHPFQAGPELVSLSLTDFDEETGKAQLAIEGLTREMNLMAVYGETAKFVQTVAAGTTALTVNVPSGADVDRDNVRFVLTDFVPVTELRSFGEYHIDTGVVPEPPTTIRYEAMSSSTSGSGMCHFGIASWFYAVAQTLSNGRYFAGYFGDKADQSNLGHYRDDGKHLFEFGEKGYYVDRVKKVKTSDAFFEDKGGRPAEGQTLWLFGRCPSDLTTTDPAKKNLDTCSIYWAEILVGGQKVRDFTPCVKDGDGALYDSVEGKFYKAYEGNTNADYTAQFAYGPIDPVATELWSCGETAPVASLLDSTPRTVTVASYDRETGVAQLAISSGTTVKELYVAAGDHDGGEDSADWSCFRHLGTIAADATSATVTVPESFRKLGMLRFFLTRQTAPYLRGVEQCEYIEAAGKSYARTAYVPQNTDTVTAKVRFTTVTSSSTVFDARNKSAKKLFGLMTMLDTSRHDTVFFRIDRGSGNAYYVKKRSKDDAPEVLYPDTSTDYVLRADFQEKKLYIDDVCHVDLLDLQQTTQGQRVQLNACEMKMERPLLVGATTQINSDDVLQTFAKARFYSLSVQNRLATTVVDLVPCVMDGVAQFYDRVTGAYYPSLGEEPFVAGGELKASAIKSAETVSGLVRGIAASAISFRVDLGAWSVTATVAEGVPSGRIFLVGAQEDKGENCEDWPYIVQLGTVTPETRTVTVSLPEEWRQLKLKQCRVFLACTEPSHPYEQLSSLISSGNDTYGQYIDTGIVPDGTTKIELRAKRLTVNGNCEFGVYTKYYMFQVGSAIGAMYYEFLGPDSNTNTAVLNDNQPHTLVFGPDGGYVDNKTVVAGPLTATDTTDLTMTLFARRVDKETVKKRITAEISYAKIWQGGKLVRDYIPCEKNGVGYFYDLVEGKFYENEGDGSFILGEKVPGRPLFDSEVLGISAAKRTGHGLMILVY